MEIVDSFGQRSLLQFTQARDAIRRCRAETLHSSTPPKGADVIEQ